jgi:hypothetical protein
MDRPDLVLGPLTARQVTILGCGAPVGYGAWAAISVVVAPLVVFLVLAVPVVPGMVVLALGERDGLSLDRLLHDGQSGADSAPAGARSTAAASERSAMIDRRTRSAGQDGASRIRAPGPQVYDAEPRVDPSRRLLGQANHCTRSRWTSRCVLPG